MAVIEVCEHDPAWARTFEDLRVRYEGALAGVPVVGIEHVGSTAVPGLAAKPVIDVDVVVAEGDVAAASARLETIGFVPLGDLGIAGRFAFRAPAELPRTNTYVTVEGCLALRNHLAVRQVLRDDVALREEYAAVKRRLVASVDDMAAYIEGKTAVLARVLERAGLSAEEREAIAAVNRAGG